MEKESEKEVLIQEEEQEEVIVLTPKEELKINNYKAQYKSILGNITIANGALGILYEEQEHVEEVLATLKLEEEKLLSEKEEFIKLKKDTLSHIADKTVAILEKEIQVGNKEQLITQYEHEVSAKLEKKEAHAELVLQDYIIEINKADEKLITLNDKIVKSAKEFKEILNELAKAKKLLKESIDAANDLEKETKESEAEIKKEKKNEEKLLKELQQQVKEEQEKIGKADQSISDREKALKVKLHDAYIIITRIRKKHKELFPELELQL